MSAGQISHGNGGSRAASLLSKGSTNWSSPGEGTGISLDAAKPSPGFKGAEPYSGRLRELVRDRQVCRAARLRARPGGFLNRSRAFRVGWVVIAPFRQQDRALPRAFSRHLEAAAISLTGGSARPHPR